jgi:heat shock protein HslJ
MYLIVGILVIVVGILGAFVVNQMGFFAPPPVEVDTDEPNIQEPFTGSYAPIATSTWRLERYSDASGSTAAPANFRASFVGTTFSAQWCNTLIAPYTVTDDTPPIMRFSILQRSKMLCEEIQMRPENALAESMRKGLVVKSFTATSLELQGRETGFEFVFRR